MATLALCSGFLVFETVQIIRYAFSPNQMDFGEGFTMYISKLWANGQFQWNPSHEPYMTLIYGVVYPTILKPFVLLFGPDLRIGRIACLIATIIIAIFIFLIARRFSKNKAVCLLAALIPMLHPSYRAWIMQARSDMVAILFAVIGVYIAIRWQSEKRILWSIPFFLLAFFTKQTTIAGAGTICVYLLIANRKMFMKYTATLIITLAAIVVTGNLLTHGEYLKQLWQYNQTIPFTFPMSTISRNFREVFYPFLLILPFIPAMLFLKRDLRKQYMTLLLWLLISVIMTCALLYRKGGFVNYGMEFIIISGLCFALLIEHLELKQKQMMTALTCVFIPTQLMLCFSVNPLPMPDKAYAVNAAIVEQIIKNTNQPVLTENAGVVLRAGKTPYYEPFVYTNLEQLGYFDEKIVVTDLNNQRMDYLVLQNKVSPTNYDHNRFTSQIVEAINSNYKIVHISSTGYWYNFCVYESNNLYKEQHPPK